MDAALEVPAEIEHGLEAAERSAANAGIFMDEGELLSGDPA